MPILLLDQRAEHPQPIQIEEQVKHTGVRQDRGQKPPRLVPEGLDVVGLRTPPHEETGPHFPLGCSLVFAPGWEVDSQGGTAGLCQPVERDIFDCHLNCFWPAHVPDQLNHAQDWTGKCASAQKDWRKLDLIFP